MSDRGPPPSDATILLNLASSGDVRAAEDLLPLVYTELRARAGAQFRDQPRDHTLQPTALVHEAYLKLIRAPQGSWRNRAHFCAIASTAMRQILVDHARTRRKLDGAEAGYRERPTIAPPPSGQGSMDILALEDALEKLARLDAQRARIVELRVFGGLTIDDVAGLLGTSRTTVVRQWRQAKAWLSMELDPSPEE